MASNAPSFTDHYLLSSDLSRQIDREQDTSTGEVLAKLHTYRMEFDTEEPIGEPPRCFSRELGDVIAPYIILRDPNHNEIEIAVAKKSNRICFTDGWSGLKDIYNIPIGGWITFKYIDPALLLLKIATRLGMEVEYPKSDPPLRKLLPRTGVNSTAGTSKSPTPSIARVRPLSFVRTYLKKMTSYDVESGSLILPWYGFGQSAFAFVFSHLVLVDHMHRQFTCNLTFELDSSNQLCCKISNGWYSFCKAHGLVEGQNVRFCVAEPAHHYILYVCVYPQIGIETIISYPISDGRQIPLYVSQNYFLKLG